MPQPSPTPPNRSPWLRLRQQLYALTAARTPAARRIAHDLMIRLHMLHARHFPPGDVIEQIDHRMAGLEAMADCGIRGASVRLAALATDIEALADDVERAREVPS